MTSRFDYSKGRYVPYAYAARGDRFARGLSALPPVHVTGYRADGSAYRRRLRTTEAKAVPVSGVLAEFRAQLKPHQRRGEAFARILDLTVFAYDPSAHRIHLSIPERGQTPPPEGVRLAFDATAQRLGGVRRWWVCPRCGSRTATVYGVTGGGSNGRPAWSTVGCRACLGLTYPSQASHKTQAHDRRVLERRGGRVSLGAFVRADEREARRWRKVGARFGMGAS